MNPDMNPEASSDRRPGAGDDDSGGTAGQSREAAPLVDLSIAEKAARRSAAGGVWSLGHLKVCWAALVAGAAILTVIAALVSGSRAVWGVLLGTAIVGVFFSISALIIARAGQRNPKLVMPAALGTYVIKIVALGVVLVTIPRDGAIDTRWMAGAVGIGLFCWLGAHMRYVWTTKLFYVDPG
jgi:ATP synthase protein I